MLETWFSISCLSLASGLIRAFIRNDRLSYGCKNYKGMLNGIEAFTPWEINILALTLLSQTCKSILILSTYLRETNFNSMYVVKEESMNQQFLIVLYSRRIGSFVWIKR